MVVVACSIVGSGGLKVAVVVAVSLVDVMAVVFAVVFLQELQCKIIPHIISNFSGICV